MTDKRYQVFISSTFRDLIDERQAVLKAVLELDHMPAGMELFPAADDTAWQLIKDVIDSSDYYVLIVGGRYGSLGEEGIGYTEKEYDYARKTKKAVVPLLHLKPDNLPRDKTETDPDAWAKLEAFRKKVEAKHTCVYWETSEDLKAKVIIGLTANIKRHPAVGWIRADAVPTDATVRDVLTLREQVSKLETELQKIRTEAPPGTEDLMQDDDTFEITYSFRASSPDGLGYRVAYQATIYPTWNEIFAGVSPVLIDETSERSLRQAFVAHFTRIAREELQEDKDLKDHTLSDFSFAQTQIDTCLVQLRALGLIRESDRKRSVTDKQTYWTLTPFGDRMMVQLRALRREPAVKRTPGSKYEVLVTSE